MSNHISLLLCLPIFLVILLFGTDIVLIQSIYSSLDTLSTTVSYKIANYGIDENGKVDKSIDTFLQTNAGAYLIQGSNENKVYSEGDLYAYYLCKDYKPFVISAKPIKVRIKRYAVIGIYHS